MQERGGHRRRSRSLSVSGSEEERPANSKKRRPAELPSPGPAPGEGAGPPQGDTLVHQGGYIGQGHLAIVILQECSLAALAHAYMYMYMYMCRCWRYDGIDTMHACGDNFFSRSKLWQQYKETRERCSRRRCSGLSNLACTC